jgi:hypothetical protein
MDSVIWGAVILAAGLIVSMLFHAWGTAPGTPTGRYQQQTGADGTCYVLNTRNGRLWQKAAGAGEWSEVAVPWPRA